VAATGVPDQATGGGCAPRSSSPGAGAPGQREAGRRRRWARGGSRPGRRRPARGRTGSRRSSTRGRPWRSIRRPCAATPSALRRPARPPRGRRRRAIRRRRDPSSSRARVTCRWAALPDEGGRQRQGDGRACAAGANRREHGSHPFEPTQHLPDRREPRLAGRSAGARELTRLASLPALAMPLNWAAAEGPSSEEGTLARGGGWRSRWQCWRSGGTGCGT